MNFAKSAHFFCIKTFILPIIPCLCVLKVWCMCVTVSVGGSFQRDDVVMFVRAPAESLMAGDELVSSRALLLKVHKRYYSRFKLSQTAVTCSVQYPTCSMRLLLSFELANFKFLTGLAGMLMLPCYVASVLSNECTATCG